MIDERKGNRDQIVALQRREREIDLEIADCEAAARVFGVQLAKPEEYETQELGVRLQIDPNVTSVRVAVLKMLKDTHPRPVQASELRTRLEHLGYDIHEKTVGMTLYRLSKAKKAQRTGLKWCFVPQEERASILDVP